MDFNPNITPVEVIKNQKSKDLSKGLIFIQRIKIYSKI